MGLYVGRLFAELPVNQENRTGILALSEWHGTAFLGAAIEMALVAGDEKQRFLSIGNGSRLLGDPRNGLFACF